MLTYIDILDNILMYKEDNIIMKLTKKTLANKRKSDQSIKEYLDEITQKINEVQVKDCLYSYSETFCSYNTQKCSLGYIIDGYQIAGVNDFGSQVEKDRCQSCNKCPFYINKDYFVDQYEKLQDKYLNILLERTQDPKLANLALERLTVKTCFEKHKEFTK